MPRAWTDPLVQPKQWKDNLEDPDVDGTIILKWIFRKLDGWEWTELIWFRIGTGDGHL